jgi:hypothetical protein
LKNPNVLGIEPVTFRLVEFKYKSIIGRGQKREGKSRRKTVANINLFLYVKESYGFM